MQMYVTAEPRSRHFKKKVVEIERKKKHAFLS